MKPLSRRRFISISAGLGAALGAGIFPGGPAAKSPPLVQWRGLAMGAEASITLAHPQADRILATTRAEIERLEQVFSLYRSGSTLSRLNAEGRLDAPPFELLTCLGLCDAVHRATGGLFDPSVQPLWRLHAAARGAPERADLAEAMARTGWDKVSVSARSIRFARAGMALTLNGVAQGFVADRIADLLTAQGLDRVLVETGEFRAVGGHPDGGAWPVRLRAEGALLEKTVSLSGRALASSAPRGTVFDAAGTAGHILDPRDGQPSSARWRLVSVSADTAALADAISTASCLMDRDRIDRALAHFADARLEHLA